MSGLFGYGPGGVPVAIDALVGPGFERKLARAPHDDEHRALALALLELRNARDGLNLGDTFIEAMRVQLRVETIPPELRLHLGLPPRIMLVGLFMEAAARDALAVVSEAIMAEPTVPFAREAIEARVAKGDWALPLSRLCAALKASRTTVRPWRDLTEYKTAVIDIARALVAPLFGEVLPHRCAETTGADVIRDFAGRAHPAATANLAGETLTASLGVGLSDLTPTATVAPEAPNWGETPGNLAAA